MMNNTTTTFVLSLSRKPDYQYTPSSWPDKQFQLRTSDLTLWINIYSFLYPIRSIMKLIGRFLFAFCLISLEFTIIFSQTEPNPEICTIETESYGLLPPTVPESFIMKAELVDLENGLVFWEELYFDSLNLRAKYKTVHQGKEFHYIFDYDVEQILSYIVLHPGVDAENDPESLETCAASDMEDNPLHRIFGYRYEHLNGKRTRMYNSYEVLEFGGNYKYAFNQTMKIAHRGIPSDVYHGCYFNPSYLATIDKMFYWSNITLIPPSGVDQVPVKIDTYGEIFTYPNQDGKREKMDVWNIESIPWFQRNPVFDESIFQVPRRMYCKNYKEVKDLPNLPKYFSGRLEATTIKRNMDGELQDLGIEQFSEIWYDSVSNMARVDFVANIEDDMDLLLYMGAVPVSGVYDVNEGVVYYTNKLNGECVPFPIPPTFFLLSKESLRKLAPPNEVLGFDSNNLEYKGKNVARNVLCNVWAGQVESDSNDDDSKDFVEVYFATDGWHSDSDEDEEYDYPMRITVINFSNENNKTFEIVSETNIFKYKATQPSPSVYDISGCLNTQNQKYFFFSIQKDVKDLLSDNRQKFLRATREAIRDYSKIGSLLRVQDVDVYVPSAQRNIIVSFSLMDTPQIFGESSKQPGTSLVMAETNLRRAIDNGDFIIQIVWDPKKGGQSLRSLPGSLIQAIPQADAYTEENAKYSYPLDERKDILQVPDLMFSEKKDNTDEGYSSGSLGGLAVGMLLLGICLGIALMYFYLKKYGQQGNSPAILMHDR